MREPAAIDDGVNQSDMAGTGLPVPPVSETAIDCNVDMQTAVSAETQKIPARRPSRDDASIPIYVAGEDIALPKHGFATISADLKTFATRHDPALAGILLLSVKRPAVDEFTMLRDIVDRQPAIIPIMVVETSETGLAVALMKAGAADVLESPIDTGRLDQAIADAVECVRLRDETLSATRLALARIDSLSPRERSVFNGLICGWPNKVIASQLELSPRTVEIHRAKMMIKLQVRTLAQALQLAFAAQITLEDAHRDQPPAVDGPQTSEASDPFSLRRSASTRRR